MPDATKLSYSAASEKVTVASDINIADYDNTLIKVYAKNATASYTQVGLLQWSGDEWVSATGIEIHANYSVGYVVSKFNMESALCEDGTVPDFTGLQNNIAGYITVGYDGLNYKLKNNSTSSLTMEHDIRTYIFLNGGISFKIGRLKKSDYSSGITSGFVNLYDPDESYDADGLDDGISVSESGNLVFTYIDSISGNESVAVKAGEIPASPYYMSDVENLRLQYDDFSGQGFYRVRNSGVQPITMTADLRIYCDNDSLRQSSLLGRIKKSDYSELPITDFIDKYATNEGNETGNSLKEVTFGGVFAVTNVSPVSSNESPKYAIDYIPNPNMNIIPSNLRVGYKNGKYVLFGADSGTAINNSLLVSIGGVKTRINENKFISGSVFGLDIINGNINGGRLAFMNVGGGSGNESGFISSPNNVPAGTNYSNITWQSPAGFKVNNILIADANSRVLVYEYSNSTFGDTFINKGQAAAVGPYSANVTYAANGQPPSNAAYSIINISNQNESVMAFNPVPPADMVLSNIFIPADYSGTYYNPANTINLALAKSVDNSATTNLLMLRFINCPAGYLKMTLTNPYNSNSTCVLTANIDNKVTDGEIGFKFSNTTGTSLFNALGASAAAGNLITMKIERFANASETTPDETIDNIPVNYDVAAPILVSLLLGTGSNPDNSLTVGDTVEAYYNESMNWQLLVPGLNYNLPISNNMDLQITNNVINKIGTFDEQATNNCAADKVNLNVKKIFSEDVLTITVSNVIAAGTSFITGSLNFTPDSNSDLRDMAGNPVDSSSKAHTSGSW